MESLSRRNALRLGLAALAAWAARPAMAGVVPTALQMPAAGMLTPFAMTLYRQLPAGVDTNTFFSPLSIVEAIGMLQAGARGQTAVEIGKAIGVSQDRLPDVIAKINDILLGKDRPYTISLANAVWAEKTFPVRDDYAQLVQTKYSATGQNCEFISQPEVERKRINDWVLKQTHDKIRDLLPVGLVDSMTRMVITNAIYFNAEWARQFEKAQTKQGDFKLDSGKSVMANLMNTEFTRLGYFEDDSLQAIDLAYKGDSASMLVLLPRKGTTIDLEKSLAANQIDSIASRLKPNSVMVTMPKFKLETEYDLNKALKAMGILAAFDENQADFSGISDASRAQKLYVSSVVHKAFVEVDEVRTEAAAATAITMRAMSMPMRPPIVFRADHPFLFIIRDRTSNEALFIGRVGNPVG